MIFLFLSCFLSSILRGIVSVWCKGSNTTAMTLNYGLKELSTDEMNKETNYREAFTLKIPSSNFSGKSQWCDSIRAPKAFSFNLPPLDTCFP